MGDPHYEERQSLKHEARLDEDRKYAARAKMEANSEETAVLFMECLKDFLEGRAGLLFANGEVTFRRRART